MKRVLMLAVVAIFLATASNADACGGCGGGFGWLGGGSCRPTPVSRPETAALVHVASVSLVAAYLSTNQATWSLAAEGLQHGLVGLANR